jgi:hypothetical protein
MPGLSSRIDRNLFLMLLVKNDPTEDELIRLV